MTYALRECPVCGHLAARVLFQQQFAALSSGSFLQSYEVVVCERCGAGYADRIPTQAEFDAHYRDMSKYEYQEREGKESEYDALRFRSLVAIIDRTLPARETRILDVGCSTGRLLALLQERGYRHVCGLDPSPLCSSAAQRLYGIQVATGSISEFAAPDGQFDLLILSGVLEHIRDVKPTLAKLQRLLSDEGRFFISVPDASRFNAAEDAPFQQFSTEHINFFSPGSLANLMGGIGCTMVLCEQNDYDEGRGYAYGGPTLDAVFKKHSAPGGELLKDEATATALTAYIRGSQAFHERIRQTIEELVTSAQPVLVWGVGTHTLRLLASSRLSEARIAAFVESNPRYHGKELHGIPIIAPADVRGRTEPILVSSRVFQKDIVRQVREDLHLPNELRLLYTV